MKFYIQFFYNFIKLLGIGIILIGFAVVTNLMNNILAAFANLFIRQ